MKYNLYDFIFKYLPTFLGRNFFMNLKNIISIFLVMQSFTVISQAGTKADLKLTDMGGVLFSIEESDVDGYYGGKKFLNEIKISCEIHTFKDCHAGIGTDEYNKYGPFCNEKVHNSFQSGEICYYSSSYSLEDNTQSSGYESPIWYSGLLPITFENTKNNTIIKYTDKFRGDQSYYYPYMYTVEAIDEMKLPNNLAIVPAFLFNFSGAILMVTGETISMPIFYLVNGIKNNKKIDFTSEDLECFKELSFLNNKSNLTQRKEIKYSCFSKIKKLFQDTSLKYCQEKSCSVGDLPVTSMWNRMPYEN
ncbi:MAG: hypothetical protein ACXVCR_09850 [Bdellovibrio sp.]